MRKIIFLIHESLDGFVAGPNGEMDWIVYNDEMEKYSHTLHESTDTAIYGRVTYQMMANYWPPVLSDPSSTDGDRAHAHWLEDATKVVVSRTLGPEGIPVAWKDAVLINDNVAEEIARMKEQPGKDMWLLGSPTLAQSFMAHNLIDEYRINVNPVVLGSGKRLFDGPNSRLDLTLLENRTFAGGVAALRYAPS